MSRNSLLSKVFSLRLTDIVFEELKQAAVKEHKDVAELIRQYIELGLMITFKTQRFYVKQPDDTFTEVMIL